MEGVVGILAHFTHVFEIKSGHRFDDDDDDDHHH